MIKLNGREINTTKFPDNTSQVWKLENRDFEINHIHWNYNNEGEFMRLAQLKELLEAEGKRSILTFSYLPYARQDKDISNESTFALIPFSKLLNFLNFERIIILDPHSETSLDLIKNSEAQYPTHMVQGLKEKLNADILCYPDNGAVIKYKNIYNEDYIYGEKKRNQITGYIEEYKVIGNPKGKNILIVDDICDGGMTFILLAKQLLEAGAKEVNLFVTHGLFTKGIECLKQAGINKIFTFDGEVNEIQNNLTKEL